MRKRQAKKRPLLAGSSFQGSTGNAFREHVHVGRKKIQSLSEIFYDAMAIVEESQPRRG